MKTSSKVFVVILNWNNWTDTLQCLVSLFGVGYSNLDLRVVLCDNGSTDDSLLKFKSWANGEIGTGIPTEFTKDASWNDVAAIPCIEIAAACAHKDCDQAIPLRLIQIGENIGFAGGNNVGIRHALANEADYIFILNNDTIVHPSCISELVEFSEKYNSALLSPQIMEPGPDGNYVDVFDSTWTRRPSFRDFSRLCCRFGKSGNEVNQVVNGNLIKLYYAPGCAMMFKAETLRNIGLFDEKTFLYYEEFIMAEKMLSAGLSTFYVPSAKIWHQKGATSSKIPSVNKYINSVVSERYYLSCYRKIGHMSMLLLIIERVLAYLRHMLWHKDYRQRFPHFLKVYLGSFSG